MDENQECKPVYETNRLVPTEEGSCNSTWFTVFENQNRYRETCYTIRQVRDPKQNVDLCTALPKGTKLEDAVKTAESMIDNILNEQPSRLTLVGTRPRETIKLPNPGYRLAGIEYDKEKDVYVIRLEKMPGIYTQVIVDTGMPLPTDDKSRIKYENVNASSQSFLEAISNSPDPLKAAREYVDRMTAEMSARANETQRKFLKDLEKRADKLERDELARQILEGLQSEPMPTPEELARFDYMRKDVVDHLFGKDKKKPKGKKRGK